MLDVETLLGQPNEAPPCGPNLEHDLSFFELEEAARPKPEQQIGDAVKPGQDPDWPAVVERGSALLLRSKDLRVALHLTRGLMHTEGIPGLAAGLALIDGLLDRYWDDVHPRLEADQDNDPTERINALAPLADPETVVKDLRDTDLVNSRQHGQLRVREVEIALGRLGPPRSDGLSAPKTLGQIHAQIASAFANDPTVPSTLRDARGHCLAIQTLVADRVGADRGIDLKPLVQSLDSLIDTCDAALGVRSSDTPAPEAEEDGGGARPSLTGDISTREEALRALDLVCSYFERHEPSHPAPLFIRRAQRLMAKNFIEIVKDLLPDSLSNLERLAGEIEDK
jgi:type VI secretion system protein ImpA